eukprot:SAG22_NODE_3611_length_1616_cov_2.639420_2_plen_48_part_01
MNAFVYSLAALLALKPKPFIYVHMACKFKDKTIQIWAAPEIGFRISQI